MIENDATTTWPLTRDHFLDEEEAEELRRHVAAAADNPSKNDTKAFVDRVIIEMLLFTGLRNTELCRLTCAQVSLGKRPTFEVVARKSRRTIYLAAPLAALLREYKSRVRPLLTEGQKELAAPDTPFLINERKSGYERTALYRRVVRILKQAGFGDRASVQLLRHTYGYLAYKRSGGNLLFVQRQLGHAHPMITSVYAQFVDEDYAALADRIHATATG